MSYNQIISWLEIHDANVAKRFKVVIGMFVVIAVLSGANIVRSIANGRAIQEDYSLSQSNALQIAAIKEKQDMYRQQYLTQIKDMIIAMNQLQELNKGKVIVPKVPVLRGPDQDLTESDLRRIPQDGPARPAPTPIVKKEVIIKYKKRPTPTPGPFQRLFGPKTTR